MRNLSLKLIFVIIIFTTVLVGSLGIANIYSAKYESLKNSKIEEKNEELPVYEGNSTPPSVQNSRDHINEQIEYGNSVMESITSTDDYIINAKKGVEAYKKWLNLPLPYELVEPAPNEVEAGVLYRPADQTGDLTRFQEEQLIKVKKERLDGFHMMLIELQRRADTPTEDRNVEDVAYLTKLAEELPFYVPPIVVGNACGGENTLGCYYHTGEIEITPLALTVNGGKDECLLLSTIAHETRHYNQFIEWGIKDHILADLEDDANQFMRDSTVERCKAPVYR